MTKRVLKTPNFLAGFLSAFNSFLQKMYRYMNHILVIFLSLIVRESISEFLWRSAGGVSVNLSFCSMCGAKPTEFVENHCHGQHIFHRCCLDSSNRTVGADFSNCSITSIQVLENMKEMSWVNLANNSNLNCSNPVFSNFFEGFKMLKEIILPSQCACPGGDSLWNESRRMEDSVMCLTQKSTCDIYNVSCPSNSHCSDDGPGFYECLCDENWLGYRCLVKNGIPLAIILGCIAGGTVLIILPIALLINRRKRMISGYIYVEGTTRT